MCSHYALQFFLSFFTFSLLNANKPYKTYFLVAFQYVYSNYVLINCSRLSINIHTEQDIDLQMSRRIEKNRHQYFIASCALKIVDLYTPMNAFLVFFFFAVVYFPAIFPSGDLLFVVIYYCVCSFLFNHKCNLLFSCCVDFCFFFKYQIMSFE